MKPKNQRFRQTLLLIACTIAMVFAAVNYTAVLRAVGAVISGVPSLLLGLGIAFFLNLLVTPIEALWTRLFRPAFAARTKRTAGILGSLAAVGGAVLLVMCIILPQISKTLTQLLRLLPRAFAEVNDLWAQLRTVLPSMPELQLDQQTVLRLLSDYATRQSESIFSQTIHTTSSVVASAVKVMVGFIFSVYVLAGKEKLGRQLHRTASALLAEKKAERLFRTVDGIGRTFRNYLTGQLIEAAIFGGLCFLGMLVFGFPYATVISVLVGLTALIPMLGAFLGAGIGAFLILAVSPGKALWFLVFLLVLQQVEGNAIYPHVVGKSVGLPGIWVLIAVTIGGGLFGIAGMLLCVPVCSILYNGAARWVNARLEKMKKNPAEE